MTDEPPAAAPSTDSLAATLQRIEARLTRIEATLAQPRDLAAALPGTTATVVDTIDSAVAALQRRGVDVDDRVRRLGSLLERTTEPRTLEALEGVLQAAASLPQTTAAVVDTIDDMMARLVSQGVDVDVRLRVVLQVAERMTAPEALSVVTDLLAHVDVIRELLDSEVFSHGALEMVGRAAYALGKIDVDKVEPVGLFGALRALGQPEMKRAVGVLVAFGKIFGGQAASSAPIAANNGEPR